MGNSHMGNNQLSAMWANIVWAIVVWANVTVGKCLWANVIRANVLWAKVIHPCTVTLTRHLPTLTYKALTSIAIVSRGRNWFPAVPETLCFSGRSRRTRRTIAGSQTWSRDLSGLGGLWLSLSIFCLSVCSNVDCGVKEGGQYHDGGDEAVAEARIVAMTANEHRPPVKSHRFIRARGRLKKSTPYYHTNGY